MLRLYETPKRGVAEGTVVVSLRMIASNGGSVLNIFLDLESYFYNPLSRRCQEFEVEVEVPLS